MSQRLDRQNERRYLMLPEGPLLSFYAVGAILAAVLITGFAIGFLLARYSSPPRIPHCTCAPDVIIGNGEYNSETGY